jgi:hypothetical protein
MVYVNVLIYQSSGPLALRTLEEHVHVTGVTEVERERALTMTRSYPLAS